MPVFKEMGRSGGLLFWVPLLKMRASRMAAMVEVWREVRDEFILNLQPGSVRLGNNWMQDYDLGKNEGQLGRNLEVVRGCAVSGRGRHKMYLGN